MIKKFLFSLLIIGLGIINFSSAYMGKVNEFVENPYYTSVEVQAQSKGMGLTKKLGTIKNVFYTVENNGFFWGARGVPYMWTYRRNTYPYLRQGYLTKYSVCDEITVDELTNCTLEDINFDTSPDVFASFFDTITSDDYYIYWGKSDGTSLACNYVCWSSHDVGKSLCFSLNEHSNCPLGNTSSYLTGSLGISLENLQFDNIDNALLFDPPGWGSNGGNSGGGTGIVLECTKQNALNWYNKNGYSKNLCYGGVDNFDIYTGNSDGSFIGYGTGKDYEEIWLESGNLRSGGSTGSAFSLESWLVYWRSMYTFYYNSIQDGTYNPFMNTPYVLYTYISAVETYGSMLGSDSISEYCDLLLYTSDYTSSYTGVNETSVCYYGNLVSDHAKDILHSGIIGGNLVGTGEDVIDGSNFIDKYFNLIDSKLGSFDNSGSSPIIPGYIVLALLGLVLFRFLSH